MLQLTQNWFPSVPALFLGLPKKKQDGFKALSVMEELKNSNDELEAAIKELRNHDKINRTELSKLEPVKVFVRWYLDNPIALDEKDKSISELVRQKALFSELSQVIDEKWAAFKKMLQDSFDKLPKEGDEGLLYEDVAEIVMQMRREKRDDKSNI